MSVRLFGRSGVVATKGYLTSGGPNVTGKAAGSNAQSALGSKFNHTECVISSAFCPIKGWTKPGWAMPSEFQFSLQNVPAWKGPAWKGPALPSSPLPGPNEKVSPDRREPGRLQPSYLRAASPSQSCDRRQSCCGPISDNMPHRKRSKPHYHPHPSCLFSPCQTRQLDLRLWGR